MVEIVLVCHLLSLCWYLCFANTIIHCLGHLVNFREYIFTVTDDHEFQDEFINGSATEEHYMAVEFADLLKKLWDRGAKSNLLHYSADDLISRFIEVLKNDGLELKSDDYGNQQQQDCHDFLMDLLNYLDRCLPVTTKRRNFFFKEETTSKAESTAQEASKENPKQQKKERLKQQLREALKDQQEDFKKEAYKSWNDWIKRRNSYSEIVNLFATQIVNEKTCVDCHNAVLDFTQINFHVSLPMDEVCTSVNNCFKKFMREENIEKVCEKCHCKNSVKKESLVNCPKFLVLHLMRYGRDENNQAKVYNFLMGINTKINIRDYLHPNSPIITAKPNKRLDYNLVSIAEHMGDNPKSGHYTALCDSKVKDAGWIKFNDESVETKSTKIAETYYTMKAYLLFYERDFDVDLVE